MTDRGPVVIPVDDLQKGAQAVQLNRNYVTYESKGSDAFVLPADFLVHGFFRSAQPDADVTSLNPILSIGWFGDGILLRPSGFNDGDQGALWVNNQTLSRLVGLFPMGVWVYFALSRSGTTVRLHTAKRDSTGAWVVRESTLLVATIAGRVNSSNLPICVGRSDASNPHQRGLGSVAYVHVARAAPVKTDVVPFR